MTTAASMNWKIYTEKGLRFILRNSENPEIVLQCKAELKRRGLAVNADRLFRIERDYDGYERDWIVKPSPTGETK